MHIDASLTPKANFTKLLNLLAKNKFADSDYTLGTPVVQTPGAGNGNNNTNVTITAVQGSVHQGTAVLNYNRADISTLWKPKLNNEILIDGTETTAQILAAICKQRDIIPTDVSMTAFPIQPPSTGQSGSYTITMAANNLLYAPGTRAVTVVNRTKVTKWPQYLMFYLSARRARNVNDVLSAMDDAAPGLRNTGVVASNAYAKFNAYSFTLGGTIAAAGMWFQKAQTPDFIHQGDWTIELWVCPTRVANTTSPELIAGQLDFPSATVAEWQLYRMGVSYYFRSDSAVSATPILIGAHTTVAGTWEHLAICRSGNTIRIFLNGVLRVTVPYVAGFSSGYSVLCLGKYFGAGGAGQVNNFFFTGHVDTLAIWKGIAKYEKDFTPGHPFTGM